MPAPSAAASTPSSPVADVSIPIDYAAAEKLLADLTSNDAAKAANTDLDARGLGFSSGTRARLGPDLFLVKNSRPTYSAASKLTTEPTISLVYMGTTCVVYAPSGWVFLNTDGTRATAFHEIFNKLLRDSATPFNTWSVTTYRIDGHGKRGARVGDVPYCDYMAINPGYGQALTNPYAPRE